MIPYFIAMLSDPALYNKHKITPVEKTLELPVHTFEVTFPSGEQAYYVQEAHANKFSAGFCTKCNRFLNAESDQFHYSADSSCKRNESHQTFYPAFQINSKEVKSPEEILQNQTIRVYSDLTPESRGVYVPTENLQMKHVRTEMKTVSVTLDQVRKLSEGLAKPVDEYKCSGFVNGGYQDV
jgi:hypothetical protein